MLLASDVN
ncbi:a1df5d27-4837-49b1-86b6-2b1652ca4c55 [Thermothielavioides terrestris]|uniref:A1df5d27-4837-49b1-86b6-2b1652ca4c55 n=1 Tax=Thermothielavioides terrestris TaxID=2587410 RepID=A0A446BF00_9PEZI|nr:a1df5d27-4837-49b1-86b6-2b1652ca4c55 [Thermothielavioides terrestris]